MTPDKINDLFDEEGEATEEESEATRQDMRTDPGLARALIQTVAARAQVDQGMAILFHMFLQQTMLHWIEERSADDAFALECSNRLVDLMEQFSASAKRSQQRRPAPPKPQRRPTSPRHQSRAERKAKKANAA